MNSEDSSFQDALFDLPKFLLAIEAYLDQVVLCGGWVPYFYRHLSDLAKPSHGPLLSHDFDVATPPTLLLKDGRTVRDHLLMGNFVSIRNREPPVVFYQHERWGEDDLAPVYGELLTPLTGSEIDKSGNRKVVRDIQEGVAAQELRYLDLLLHEPLSVCARQVLGPELQRDLEVRIPNPATYILQKAMALKKRRAARRLKDLAYVFEVATLWFHHPARVRTMFRSITSRSDEWSIWGERGGQILLDAFASADSEGPISAEQVFGATVKGHLVTATTVASVTGEFLKTVIAEA